MLWSSLAKGTPDEPMRDEVWLRFVTGRPVGAITIQFLDWCYQRLAAQGKRHWLLIWDNASWHDGEGDRPISNDVFLFAATLPSEGEQWGKEMSKGL